MVAHGLTQTVVLCKLGKCGADMPRNIVQIRRFRNQTGVPEGCPCGQLLVSAGVDQGFLGARLQSDCTGGCPWQQSRCDLVPNSGLASFAAVSLVASRCAVSGSRLVAQLRCVALHAADCRRRIQESGTGVSGSAFLQISPGQNKGSAR